MSESKLKMIQDFEWGSVGRYMHYISAYLGLVDLNMDAVYSFPYQRLGAKKLRAKKLHMLRAIEGNMSSLEVFVKDPENNIGGSELVVIRTMYGQLKEAKSIALDHLDTVTALESARLSAEVQMDGRMAELLSACMADEGDGDDGQI